MKQILISAILLCALQLSAQEVRELNLTNFAKIDLGGAFTVELINSDKNYIRIEADEDLMEDIISEVRGSTLKVYVDRKSYNAKKRIYLKIEFEALEEIEISGAVDLETKNMITANDFKIDFSGAGNANLELTAESLEVEMSGAGDIDISGKVDRQDVDISGVGTYAAYGLECAETEVDVSGVGSAQVVATQSIVAQTSGVGSVRYKGDPKKVKVDSSGIGKVKKG
ncbi:MAG: head GIN domain-containing protein [Cyclobacteriaceae bacterium]